MQQENTFSGNTRLNFWFALLALLIAGFLMRLFDLQVVKRNYYRQLAISSQLKEYQIPARRGAIEAHDGERIAPLVLNEKKYTLFADPVYIKDTLDASTKIVQTIGGNAVEYEQKMRLDTRYSVLATKLDSTQKEKIDALKISGIGVREVEYRTYPQGELAARTLGFVNNDGEGKYGVEQALNSKLSGRPGLLKAITDAGGIPLLANKDNIIDEPQPGKKVLLTLDLSMQKQAEDLLKQGLDRAKSKSGSVLIMDPHDGKIKAMATYPGYNPAEFYNQTDPSTFINPIAGVPIEVGSIMKSLTAAAALDLGVITKDSTYYDASSVVVDGHTITNVRESGGPGTRNLADILRLSLNTGAIHMLKQMGGGELNEQGRVTWHDYMVNRYFFGKLTGVEQGYEAEGQVPDPKDGFGLNVVYANSSFGQGLNITPIQFTAAFCAAINGGNYYKSQLVDAVEGDSGDYIYNQPQKVREQVVKPNVSSELTGLLRDVFTATTRSARPGYLIGGKTGTPQILEPNGKYSETRAHGTYVGFVGGAQPEYVIFVFVDEPKIAGYGGSQAARPIFIDMANMLINSFNIPPAQ